MNYKKIETGWALLKKTKDWTALLGVFCWNDTPSDTKQRKKLFPRTKMFRIRQDARNAQKTCCYDKTKVVKVKITIEIVEKNSIETVEIKKKCLDCVSINVCTLKTVMKDDCESFLNLKLSMLK